MCCEKKFLQKEFRNDMQSLVPGKKKEESAELLVISKIGGRRPRRKPERSLKTFSPAKGCRGNLGV